MRLHNLSKWAQLPPTDGLRLGASDTRQVRLDVNTTLPTRIDAVVGGQGTFLAIVDGYQTLEFTIEGDAELMFSPSHEDGEVWYFTNEGGDQPFEVPDVIPFVSIMNRRARNHALEEMMFRANQNIERRLAHLDAEYAELKSQLGYDPDTGIPNDDDTEVTDDDTGGTEGGEAAKATAEPSGEGKAASTAKGTGVPTGSGAAK